MTLTIRPYQTRDYDRVVDICVRAFTPIHAGFAETLGAMFPLEFPDWKGGYADTLAKLLEPDPNTLVHVAELDGVVVGFISTIAHERKVGEIGLNAVDPDYQRKGVARALMEFGLKSLKERGSVAAYVGTGGDEAHMPARSAYKALGFDTVIPSVHLYKKL